MRSLRGGLLPLGLAALAFLVRALPAAGVFRPDGVHLFGSDAHYHMRRILYGLERFPALLRSDPYVNFPEGAKPIWTPAFDGLLTLLVRPFYRAGEPATAERLVVWAPPVLGAATVAALVAVARRRFGSRAALLAGLLLCVLSGHFWYSRIGFVDHHAAVALATTLLLGAVLAVLAPPGGGARPVRAALGLGAALGGTLVVWPGALGHVAVAEAGLLLHAATRPDAAAAARQLRLLAGAQLVAAAATLPFAESWPQWSPLSPVVLSLFQPLFFGALALHAGASAILLPRSRTGRSPGGRIALLAGLGLALALGGLLLPEVRAGLGEGADWLLKREIFQAVVAESLPLLIEDGRVGWQVANLRLSLLFPLFPALLAVALWRARHRSERTAVLFLAAWSLALVAATLLQRRFFNSLSVALALATGLALARLWEEPAFRAWRARASRGRRLAAGAGAFAILAGLLGPTFEAYRIPALDLLARAEGSPPVPTARRLRFGALGATGEWLRRRTPPTEGYFAAELQPAYGVLAFPSAGHVLRYVGRRPMVVDNFGDDVGAGFERFRRYAAARKEAAAVRLLEALDVRFVVAQPLAPRLLGLRPGGVLQRLHAADGQGLARHRLRFEAPWPRRIRSEPSRYKVFERVPGAQIGGAAPAGARVRAELELVTNRGRRVRYERSARADAAGRYRLRVPYATQDAPPDVRAEGPYRLRAGGRSDAVAVRESDVQRGRSVPGPDLRARRGPGGSGGGRPPGEAREERGPQPTEPPRS